MMYLRITSRMKTRSAGLNWALSLNSVGIFMLEITWAYTKHGQHHAIKHELHSLKQSQIPELN
jgi:hypothetical protein